MSIEHLQSRIASALSISEAEMHSRKNAWSEVKSLLNDIADHLGTGAPVLDHPELPLTLEADRSLTDAAAHGQARDSALPRIAEPE